VLEEVNRSSGEVYRQQWAFFEAGGVERPFKVGLGKSGPAFKVGEYELSPESFVVSMYDKLQLRYPELVAVSVSALKKSV
jgi:hypothetical protein